jgi:two-component system response regulator YesN
VEQDAQEIFLMDKYSVLLVDDEEDVFAVIMKKLDWEAMGFRVAGYARNGVEALEMAEELQPDVVMTDIKMPYMDGLTLSHRLKELYENVKIIIFSGFDEFEYAKEAIKIEAEEYILKPINANELKEVFERIRVNLDREIGERRDMDKLRQYYLESLPVLQENFYTSLIEGNIPEEKLEQFMSSYQVNLTGPYFAVTILHIGATELSDGIDPLLIAMSVRKLAEEQLMDQYSCRMFTYLRDTVLIAQLKEREDSAGYTDALDRFCRLTGRVLGATVTAGIGQICNSLMELPQSYAGARNAISYRVLYGNGQAINISEIAPQEKVDSGSGEQAVANVFKMIRMGSEQDVIEAVRECVDRSVGNDISIGGYRVFVMGLVTEIFRFAGNNRINLEEIFGADSDIYNDAMQLESREALCRWLTDASVKMRERVLVDRQKGTSTIVAKAVDYVRDNFADSGLTVDTVCKNLGVSTAYFSTIFKRETGKTFINFLTEYRMEIALELLMTADEKTYVIAEKTGYSDPNYFSYVFKKQFGMSPSKYKASKASE